MTATTSKLGADMLTDEQRQAVENAVYGRTLTQANVFALADLLSVRQPAAIDKDTFAEYRRGVKEAFHLADMINANRRGCTAEETCSHLVGSLATLANGGEAPAAIGIEAERYRWLRDRSNDIEWPIGAGWGELGEAEGQEFDAIVDNAMRASNGT